MVSLMESEAKRSKFITSLSSFLNVAGAEAQACIWIGSLPLSQREKPFHWFNYLFNGVLEDQINQFTPSDQSLFRTEQFGNEFHLLHIHSESEQLDQACTNFLKMIPQPEGQNSKRQILILSEKPLGTKKWLKDKSMETVEYFY